MTKRFNVLDKNKNIVGIKVETQDRGSFTIPVADVRVNRPRAEKIIKAANIQAGSKFFKPSYSGMGYKY